MKLAYQYMAIFFTFPPTSSHPNPLQVENCDSNSRLVVDEDDNGNSGFKGLMVLSLFELVLETCSCCPWKSLRWPWIPCPHPAWSMKHFVNGAALFSVLFRQQVVVEKGTPQASNSTPANTRLWTNAGLLSCGHRRRWTKSKPALIQLLAYAGTVPSPPAHSPVYPTALFRAPVSHNLSHFVAL